ncbi:MAG: HlyD family secretion protein [Marinifilaceae bacterium]
MPQNPNNIELRSEEVQEILGHIPHWIIRRGISLIFTVIFIIIVGSYFFRYPDIIPAKVILTTENPPAKMVAKVNGTIDQLLVQENQMVEPGQILALIENSGKLQDVNSLRKQLDQLQSYFTDFNGLIDTDFTQNYQLGEIQSYYASFLKQFSDYQDFIDLEYHARKIESKKDQVAKYNLYYNRLFQQRDILEKELEIAEQQFHRDSVLYRKGVLALADYQISQKAYLDQSYSFHGARTSLANTQISISALQQEIMDLELSHVDILRTKQNSLVQAYDNLKAQIDIWEQRYLLRSPIKGFVSFNKFWSLNQQVKAGERVLTVIPEDSTKIFARIELGLQGAGKVKVGQKVNIKLDNYPFMEYGMLEGQIQSISLVPDDQKYSCEVRLTNGLETNYGKKLDFSQQMEGASDIITEDIRLLQRIFNPIRALFSEHV